MKPRDQAVFVPKYLKIVILFTLTNIALLGFRDLSVRQLMASDHVHDLDFLLLNLLSGFVPLAIAFVMARFNSRINPFFFWFGSFLWLLFYPNSPYMISDLIHDSLDTQSQGELIVFDTLIIFSIAMLSVFYGFLSLKIMYNLFRIRYNKILANTAIVISLFLSCLGFYIGRELAADQQGGKAIHGGNFYSQDLFTHPGAILRATWDHLFPISEHYYAYEMMLLFGIIQYMLLVMMKDVQDIEASEVVTKA